MPDNEKNKKIVVIDDEKIILTSCEKILTKVGYHVDTFKDGIQGLKGVERIKPDLVIIDLKMPGIGGMEVISKVHEFNPDIIIIVITGYATVASAVEAIKAGAYDFLPKPFLPDELRIIVNRGLKHLSLLFESRRLEMERELIKRRFISLVAHQLQTPLVAIHQYLDVMRHIGETPESSIRWKEWLERCIKRTNELLDLVKDWLTLSKVESEIRAEKAEKVDIKPIILNILETYEKMAEDKSISIKSELPEESCYVIGDKNSINVLFDNLITNAIKYNKYGGEVTITADVNSDNVTVSIKDTGIGIPEEYRKKLFEDFFRIKGQSNEYIAGSGLGLAICKRIISKIGGTIEVDSKVNVGSTFRVSLLQYKEPRNNNKRWNKNETEK